eukprot:7274225-Pyramimonas_sp.AAC.1
MSTTHCTPHLTVAQSKRDSHRCKRLRFSKQFTSKEIGLVDIKGKTQHAPYVLSGKMTRWHSRPST